MAHMLTKWNNPNGTQESYDWFKPKGQRRLWSKFVCKDLILPMHSFIFWFALQGRIMTGERINWVTIDQTCAIRALQDELVEHLFFKCLETKKGWEEVKFWIGLRRRATTIKGAIKWMAMDKAGSAIV